MRWPLAVNGVLLVLALPASSFAQQPPGKRLAPPARLAALKREAASDIDAHPRLTQQIVDQIFSYGELGSQEVETRRSLVKLPPGGGVYDAQGSTGRPS